MSLEMNEKGSVVVRVLSPQGMSLHQQAFVRLYSMNSGVLLSGGMTNLDGSLSFTNLPGAGYYTIEVSAAGYQTQRKTFNVSDTFTFTEVDVTMQPAGAESTVTYAPASTLPRKARKHIDKGVIAFHGGRLKQAQKELIGAYNAAPESPITNFLLGVLYLRMKDPDQSERYFTSAIRLDPKDVPALVGLGHVRYQKADLKGSQEALQKALALDPKQWEALWLLAEIDLRQQNFAKAREEAESAVQFGHGKADGAQFVAGIALAELGRTEDALKALRAFLRNIPEDTNAPLARKLIAQLEMEGSPRTGPGQIPLSSRINALQEAAPSALAVSAPALPLPGWEPPSIDQEKPPIADGVTCPAAEVIQKVGERVTELVHSVNRIEATETLTHEELSTLGRPVSIENRKFDYQISITNSSLGLPEISEDRLGPAGNAFVDQVSMFGLADLPLVFHPSLRGDFRMVCEGLGKWEGRATWLVHFTQRSDRPEQIRSYQLLNGSSYTAAFKGRAWVAADSYQIVRIRADLMRAIPQVGLGSEEDVIEYEPVPFRSKNVVLWLPKGADIYYFYKHRPYHRHHAFTNYRLFSVSSSQKIDLPDVSDREKNEPR